MSEKSEELLVCYHCGNKTPHRLISTHCGQELYENIDGHRYHEDFQYNLYQCPTCKGISIYGDFLNYPRNECLSERRIYPLGSLLLPQDHKLASSNCVPVQILRIYEEIWPLRHIAPNAFAGQIRRALEFICKDKKAEGKTLYQQLKHLVTQGTFPGYFSEITDLMRHTGNIGSHASQEEIDFWDAELFG